MKISAKTDYACRALLELALHWPKTEPLAINVIAASQKVPIKFLTHILITLKQLDYVTSSRGNKGGYVLIKPPSEISLGEIVKHFNEIGQTKPNRTRNRDKKEDALNVIWREADQVLFGYLDNISFDDLLKRAEQVKTVLMYTI